MFLALVLAAATPPTVQPRVEARATVRIVRPTVVNSGAWDRASPQRRRERIVRDERGAPTLLRFIEFE